MKTRWYKMLLILTAAAMLLLACGCGGNNAQSAPASQSAAQPEENSGGEAGQGGTDAGPAENADDAETPEAAAQGMDIEQYREMAARFAFYCDSVCFDYQGDRGTVTILDIQVEEDTQAQCRIRVYYQEPELVDLNSWTAATDGYMIFAIDKATSQGRMECWEFLGVPGEYLPESVDQMAEAEFYSGFVYTVEDVYDFAAGTIRYSANSAAEGPADVNAYWEANSLQ